MDMYIIASIVSVIYLIISIIEVKFSSNETPPIKELFKNTAIAFISTLSAVFISQQLNENKSAPTEIFTSKPDF
jgi:hypothetical protein